MGKRFSHAITLVLVLSLAGGAWADLVGHWRFDEGAGTVAADSSGSGNDGALTGSLEWVPGQLGSALQFDGDDWVDCGDVLTLTETLTIACWVNPAVLAGDQGFVTREAAYAFKSSGDFLRFTTPGILDYNGNNTILETDTWQHVAVTFVPNETGGCVFYLNGVETDRVDSTGLNAGAGPFRMGNNQWGQLYSGMLDDVQVYDHLLTPEEIAQAMLGVGPELAADPSPENEAVDVPRAGALSWTPGEFAATHDVYLGTVFDDVNDASRTNPLGTLASEGQATDSYDPDGLLDFGQIYYWRIDEVNAAPDNTIFKGDVWSFTTEPFAYAIADVNATSNGTPDVGADPENMVNGSGLNADDQHSTAAADMWLAAPVGDEPIQIQFAFDRVYKMHEMLVWNYNVQFELLLGFGVKNVTVEYSENGVDWTVLGDVDLNQASARADYTANSAIDLQGVPAQYVRLTVNSGFGMMGKFGLSEVRFMQIPVQAREPQPDDGATDVSVDTMLGWRAGREAVSHEVSFGTDPNALALAGAVETPSFAPGTLDLGITYYWQVNEVNDAEAVPAWEGSIWSFSTQEYAIVDDFESYDDEENRIYETWLDGWVNETGSTVGHLEAPFAETVIVHSGSQAMPLFYDNTGVATSEADFELSQNWTASGIQSLSLYFQGTAGNNGQLYVKINGTKVVYEGAATDIATPLWQPWNIDLSSVSGLANVTKLTIGVEGAGASGVVYIDDIRLHPQTPEYIVPVEPDSTGLVALYKLDGNADDGSGNGFNGTVNGAPTYVTGKDGQAIQLNGTTDYVVVGSVGISGAAPRTISGWVKPDTLTIPDWTNIFGFTSAVGAGNLSFDMNKRGGQNQYCIHVYGWEQNIMEIDLEWHHLAATYDGTTIAWYGDGRFVASADREIDTEDNVHMGKRANNDAYWPGSVDEVRIYNRALSADEIAGLAGRTEPLHKPF